MNFLSLFFGELLAERSNPLFLLINESLFQMVYSVCLAYFQGLRISNHEIKRMRTSDMKTLLRQKKLYYALPKFNPTYANDTRGGIFKETSGFIAGYAILFLHVKLVKLAYTV